MNVLIIENSKRSLQIMRRFLAKNLPDVAVNEYQPEQAGMPPPGFDWGKYAVVFVSEDLGAAGTGIEWLQKYGQYNNFPASVLISSSGEQRIVGEALKAGAHTVIVKRDLSPDSLSEAATAAVSAFEEKQKAGKGVGVTTAGGGATDEEIVEQARGEAAGEGGYAFKRLIGQGAMSRVYLAERMSDNLTVVLKIMDGNLSAENESVKRFIQEASLAQEINSPHVVKIYEQGFTNKYGFMAMEFFSRGDLKQRIENGISPNNAFRYCLAIASGLEKIHGVGIIHRDLKPANIMFRGDDQLAIADFGISKRVDQTTQLTQVGMVMGTPYYMSPEQLRAEPLDQRADLYSLGIIMFELLTGRKPFDADSIPGIALKHLQTEAEPLPNKFKKLEPVFRKLIEKDRATRYSDASEVIADMTAIAKK